MSFDNYGWPPPSAPIKVSGGLTTRQKRGAIGETWWSRRFIDVLESFGMESRLARGRTYARKGQVVSLDVHNGIAHALVQGSRARPYRVTIAVDELSDDDWRRVDEAFAKKAVFLAKLLAGEMPQNIEDAFAACKLSLFPSHAKELETTCSCPDDANPCKHIAAALYLFAESFDDDPFRIFEWRGRSKTELLSALSRQTTSEDSTIEIDLEEATWSQLASAPALEKCIDDFWALGLLETKSERTAPSYADVLLRQMDPFPHLIGDDSLATLLAPSLIEIAAAAEELKSS